MFSNAKAMSCTDVKPILDTKVKHDVVTPALLSKSSNRVTAVDI